MSSALRLAIVVISLNNDIELENTLTSISTSDFLLLRDFPLLPLVIQVIAVPFSPSYLPSDNLFYESKFGFETLILNGCDNGIYDAMNIGVKYAQKNACSHLLFLNSGVEVCEDFNSILFSRTLFDNPEAIILCNSLEKIPRVNKPVRQKYWTVDFAKWQFSPTSMPACHHSIVYPINCLIRYPFLVFKYFIASDYLNILQLRYAMYTFIPVNTCLSVYTNNGVSSIKFNKSILQRAIAYYISSDKLLNSLFLYLSLVLRLSVAKLIGLR